MEAALKGTRDIGLAVLATTLSLVIIFLPVAMMSGIVGRFMSSFGYTAAFADHGLAAGQLHTDADALRPLPARRPTTSHDTKDSGFFKLIARSLCRDAAMVHAPSLG